MDFFYTKYLIFRLSSPELSVLRSNLARRGRGTGGAVENGVAHPGGE